MLYPHIMNRKFNIVQIAPIFIALSFIGWILFVVGFGLQNKKYAYKHPFIVTIDSTLIEHDCIQWSGCSICFWSLHRRTYSIRFLGENKES